MNSDDEEIGLGLGDILRAILRHWKLSATMAVLGLGAAGAVYFLSPPDYECQAKLLVRYLVERGGIDSEMKSEMSGTAGVINNEIEILSSWDLARMVANEVGPSKLVTKSATPPTKDEAAKVVKKDLVVTPVRESSVIQISYRNRDPKLACMVLDSLINRYYDRHLEIHRSLGGGQFVAERAEAVQSRLREIDSELNQLQADGGILVMGENLDILQKQKSEALSNLLTAEAERAGQQARIQSLEVLLHGVKAVAKAGEVAPKNLPGVEEVTSYSQLVERLEQVRKRSLEMRAKFTETNPLVLSNQREIESLESRRLALAVKYPTLVVKAGLKEPGSPVIDLDSERAALAQNEGRISILKANLEELDKQYRNLPDDLRKIKDLERVRAVEEENYRYLESSIEKSRLDSQLDPAMMPNISRVQGVSPPVKIPNGLIKKLVVLLAGGGFGLAFGIPLLIEFVFDRRIRGPEELVGQLHLPLLLSIPLLNPGRNSDEGPEGEERFRPYAAGLLGRLFYSIEQKKDRVGPKLIGCTSIGEGAGVTTISQNLASASRWGAEKTLLVEVTDAFNGPREPGEFSEYGDWSWVRKDRLRLSGDSLSARNIKAFLDRLKGSDYEVAIFDLPVMGTASPSFLLAGFLDEILLIVDPGTAQRDFLKSSFEELAGINPNVKCVYNKADEPVIEKKNRREESSEEKRIQKPVVSGAVKAHSRA